MFPFDLLHAKLDDPFYQTNRHRLIDGELDRPLGSLVARQIVFESLDAGGCRVEADVGLECGKVDEVLVEHEGRHPVLDGLLRFRGCLPDDGANTFQMFLGFWLGSRDVVVNRGCCHRRTPGLAN